MQGHPEVIARLKQLLAGELAARDQYFIHSRMYAEWGYGKLHARFDHEMQEETAHAHALIARILMLGGTPEMKPEAVQVGQDVPDMLRKDLALELGVRKTLQEAIALCETQSDYVSRQMLIAQLKDTEEDHAHWLEQQLRLIDAMGLPNYLQSQTS